MHRHLIQLEITTISPEGLSYSSVLALDELSSLLAELGIASDLAALRSIRRALRNEDVAILPSEPGETITLRVLRE